MRPSPISAVIAVFYFTQGCSFKLLYVEGCKVENYSGYIKYFAIYLLWNLQKCFSLEKITFSSSQIELSLR